MNIVKVGLLLLTGLGFGFGVDSLANAQENPIEQEEFDNQFTYGHCYQDEDFLVHMLEGLSTEEQELVQNKIDEMLLTYEETIDTILYDRDLHFDFMNELIQFLEDNNIDYHTHYDQSTWHHGMGMRRR